MVGGELLILRLQLLVLRLQLLIPRLQLLKLGDVLCIRLPERSIRSEQIGVLPLSSGDLTPHMGQPRQSLKTSTLGKIQTSNITDDI